ncbi:MAG: hypothetical protein O3C40_12530 [Planctomycetota bacterium]|nr:hypothetical protein [Planctomycetota bacterium]
MTNQTPHEPNAPVMSAADVWEDSETLSQVLRDRFRTEMTDRGEIPFPAFLAALDTFTRDELSLVRERITEKLAT